MDVGLGSGVQHIHVLHDIQASCLSGVPSELLGNDSILFGTLSSKGRHRGFKRGNCWRFYQHKKLLLLRFPFGGVVCNTTTFKLRRSFHLQIGMDGFLLQTVLERVELVKQINSDLCSRDRPQAAGYNFYSIVTPAKAGSAVTTVVYVGNLNSG